MVLFWIIIYRTYNKLICIDWLFLSIAAAVIFGISNIINKEVLEKEHSLEFLSVYYLFNLFIVLPFIKNINTIDYRILFAIILRSIFMVMYMTFYTKALKHMQISVVGPLTNLNPLFVLGAGFLILGELITSLQILGIVVLLIGSYVLNSDGHFKNWGAPFKKLFKSKYMSYMIYSGICYVGVSLLAKYILRDTESFTLLFYHYIFTTLIYLGITFFIYKGIDDIIEGIKLDGFWIFVSAAIGTLGTYLIYLAFSNPNSSVGIITAISRIQVLVGVVFGGRLFHETNIFLKSIASILMLIGIYLIVI